MKEDRNRHKKKNKSKSEEIVPPNDMFVDLLGHEIILTLRSDQLNLLGQTFRPIFCGTLDTVNNGYITLHPVIVKMSNAPFHRFPTPLSFPIEHISNFAPFNSETRFPIP